MMDIRIQPIFNQTSPKLWRDVLSIGTSAMIADYKHGRLANFEDWCNSPHDNIMFGAYDGDKMVGFSVARRSEDDNKQMYLDGLYILPEYQNAGIGARLLSQTEIAGALRFRTGALTALPLAQSFYMRHGWTPLYDNIYHKNLSAKCAVVPVFRITPTIVNAYKKITGGRNLRHDMLTGDIVYGYINVNATIAGIAIARPDSETAGFDMVKTVIAPGSPTKFIESQFAHAIGRIKSR